MDNELLKTFLESDLSCSLIIFAFGAMWLHEWKKNGNKKDWSGHEAGKQIWQEEILQQV